MFSQTDILHDGVVKEHHILKHHGIVAEQHLRAHGGDIHAPHPDRTAVNIPEPGGKACACTLPRSRRANQSCDLPFLRSKAHSTEHLFIIIGKADIVKYDIMAFRPETFHAVSSFCVVNLYQPTCGNLRHKHLRNQRQCLIKRRIDAGDDHQEHKQHQKVSLPGKYQFRPGQDCGCNTKPHNDTCCIDKNTGRQLTLKHRFLMVINLIIQSLQETVLLVCRTNFPDVLQCLLDAV